jgi:hypothetical protein
MLVGEQAIISYAAPIKLREQGLEPFRMFVEKGQPLVAVVSVIPSHHLLLKSKTISTILAKVTNVAVAQESHQTFAQGFASGKEKAQEHSSQAFKAAFGAGEGLFS